MKKDLEGNEILSKFSFCIDIKKLSENGGIGIFLFFFFVKYIAISLLIIIILNSIPTMYLSNEANIEILTFCNRTENIQNFPICKKRLYNNTDFVLSFSTQNLKIYDNITKEFELQKNITYTGDTTYTKVDFNLLSLITQITLLIIYFLFYNNVKNQSREVDIMNLSPSDYTLMMSEFKLPYDVKDFDELKKYLETEVEYF